MRRAKASVAWVAAVVLLLVGCTDRAEPPNTGSPGATVGRSSVAGPEGWKGKITISAPNPTAPLLADTASLLDAGFMLGTPVELSTTSALPRHGVTISRTYPVPLGAQMASTLAFFNPEAGGWQAVPSSLSKDRRTVSATVSHLSVWNDVVSGTKASLDAFRSAAGSAVHSGAELTRDVLSSAGKTIVDAFDWMYYAVGKIFDTRVTAPSCEDKRPDWVASVTFIEDNRNNPIRFCAGRDANHPDQLVVKARVNRGFAFAAKPATRTLWRYNSSDKEGLWDALLPWLASYDAALRDALLETTGGDPRWSVGAGQELSIGLSESAIRSSKQSAVLELQPPDAVAFLTSLLGQLIGQDLTNKDVGAVSATLAVSSCLLSVKNTDRDDPLSISASVLTCLQSQSETITKLVVRAMTETGRDSVKTVNVARVMTRASIWLALVGPVFSAMNWAAETATAISARTVSVEASVRRKTQQIVLDIYGADAQVRPIYRIEDRDGPMVDCSQPSRASMGPAVFECGSVADDLPACWKNLDGSSTVLCLRRPWENTLVRVPVMGSGVSDMSGEPVPLAVELVDGTRWWLRLGGAWGNYGKDTAAAYGPETPDDVGTVLLERSGEPLFTKEGGTWSILRGPDVGTDFNAPDRARRVAVAKAWFVTGRW